MIIALDREHLDDIDSVNQPFPVIGRLIPAYAKGKWSWTETLLETPSEKYYEEEERDWEEYIGNPDKAVYMCYREGKCAGRIVLYAAWNRYAFIEDLAVAREFRRQGVGMALMEQAKRWAQERGLGGLALETQDVNLIACRFYQKCGMEIGAVNTMLYKNMPAPACDEIAIFWYYKLP